MLRAFLSRCSRLAIVVTATASFATTSTSFAAGLTFSPTSLPAGEVGAVYEQTITASGSFNALYYSIAAGALPNGLSLHSSFGVIAGTPTATGTFNFSVYVDDGMNASGTQSYSIMIAEAPAPAVTQISPASGSTAGGTSVTLTGTNFTGATAVMFGANPATSFMVNSGTQITATSAAGPAGAVNIRVTTSGGTSATAAGNQFTYEVPDTTPPAAPVVTTPANGATTNDNTPTCSGTAEANATVTVIIDGVATGTAVANGGSSWFFTPSVPLADGSHSVKANATDTDGNTGSDSNTHTFTVDTTPPPAPVVLTPADGTSTTNQQPAITGMAEAGSTVTIIIDASPVGTATALGNSSWSLTSGTLSNGSHTVKATATDSTGNTSSDSNSNTFTVGLPSLSIDDVTLTENAHGSTTTFTFTVTLSRPAPDGGVTVDYATVDNTAIAGTDYVATSGTLTFAAGDESKTIEVTVSDDDDPEPAEAFMVDLGNASGATLSDAQAVGEITNDDVANLQVEITASPAFVKSDSRVTYTVVLKNEGNTTAANTRLSLSLPTGMSIVSFIAPPGWSASTNSNGMASTVQATTRALAADQQVAFRLIASVDSSHPNGTGLILDATATSDTEESSPADNQATASVTFAPAADLTLSVTPPAAGSVVAGELASYTITLSNQGPSDAASVAVYAKLSGRAELSSAASAPGWSTVDYTGEPNEIFFTGALATGESVNLVVTVLVPGDVPTRAGVELYAVAASLGTSDPNLADNVLTHHALVGAPLVQENARPLGDLAAGTRVTGNLYPVSAIDLYSFTAQAGDRFSAATDTTASSAADQASRDTVLTLVAADGSSVIELDDDDGALSSTSSSLAGVPLPTSGTYYLLVSCQRPQQVVFPYDLYVRLQSGTPSSETSATASTPGQILSGAGWASGNLQNGAEVDTYQVTLNAGDTIFASLDLAPARDGSGWDGRLGLRPVFNPSQHFAINGSDAHRIHEPDDDTPPGSEALLLTVKDTGDYTLAVSSADGNHGTYHLSVSVIPAATENATAYHATVSSGTIADGGTLTSTLAIPATQRIGKLKVALNLTHANLPDLDVHLTAPGGNTVGLFRNVSDSVHTTLDVILDDAAAYAIGFDQEDADNPLPEVAGAIFKPGPDYRLAWFAGQQAEGDWTLTIRDRNADGQAGTLNGWSLIVVADDELPSGTKTEHFSTNFESNDGGFAPSSENNPNQWQYGTSLNDLITGAHSGTKVWKTNIKANYDSWSSQDLLSPAIDLTGVPSDDAIVLTWAMSYQLGDASRDGAYLEVQEVGGSNLSRVVWRWLGSAMRDTNVGFDGDTVQESAGWGLHRADLSDFAGKTVRVRFHLDRTSNDTFAGLAIDDVSVASYHEEPPTVVSVVRHHNAPATTTAGTLMYRVQFSKNVENVTAASFTLTNLDGDVSGVIGSVVGSGSVYYVAVTDVTGDGALRLDVRGGSITDEEGLALAGDFTSGQTYTRTAHARAYAWGSNSAGKLGDGTEFSREFPAFVRADAASALAGKTVAALAYGGEHTLALDSSGKVYAWGNNIQRQLGSDSDEGVIPLPVAVSTDGALAGKTVVAIAAGYVHSLALDTEGRVYSWGYNQHGELGLGSTAENVGEPTLVGGLLSGKTIVAIAAGRDHSLALASDGSLYAWGSANEAQLGNGISGGGAKSNVPVTVKMDGALADATIVSISAGSYHNLVVTSDGMVYGWGNGSMGQLGHGAFYSAAEPVMVDVGANSALASKTVVAVAAGGNHSLALDSDGKVYAWGFNISGQLGIDNGPGPHPRPLAVNLPEVTATAISAGNYHSFALTSEGALYGWGGNYSGQLGIGTWDESYSPEPVDTSAASALQGATAIALGSGGGIADHTLVIALTSRPIVETITTPDTAAYKAGRTLVFELTADRAVSVNTAGGTPRLVLFFEGGEVYADYVSTSVDGKTLRFTYTIKQDDGSSFGIGLRPHLDLNGASIVDAADSDLDLTPAFPDSNLEGVIIDTVAPTIGSIARAGGATPVNGLPTVAFNVSFSEAVTSDGADLSVDDFSLVASDVTGRVSDVRLVINGGNGRATRRAAKGKSQAPVTVYRVTVVDLAGEDEFKLALNDTRPIRDVAGNPLTGSATSQTYTRFERATAFAWGKGDEGQLGNGNSETSGIPVPVEAQGALAGKVIVAIAHGTSHTLALTSGGEVFGWGSNFHGQLAIEDDTTAEPVAISPTGALNGKFIVAIAAGDAVSVALTSHGEVITWGRNENGELGIDSEDDFNVIPTLVDLEDFGESRAPRIAAISSGARHVLALTEDGNVLGWGANDVGQLGNEDTTEAQRTPVFAGLQDPVTAISAGANHSLALTFDGDVLSWGGNDAGQLGDGSEVDREFPQRVQFSDLDSASEPADAIASISAGGGYSLALTADGRLFSWGANDTGQLGLSITDNVSEPARVGHSGDTRFTALAPGRHHVLAFDSDGAVHGWGDNFNRQLALTDDEIFRAPILLELPDVDRAFVLGFGVTAAHSTLLGVTTPSHHAADTNQNGSLSLLELTRVIELYNTRDGTIRTGSYHSESGTEDGFAAGTGTIARHHSADTNQDGRLGLLELTRVIELYNTRDGTTRTGAYHRSEFSTEDGFAPGPGAKQ